MHRPSIIAHRGASGYEYENSLAAFRRAVLLDAEGVELDVHATRDGELVVHHDPDLPGLGPIRTLTGAEAAGSRLPNGEPVPLLPEVLQLCRGLDVWVEVKGLDARWDEALLRALDAGPTPDRYAVHAFDHRIIRRLGERRPGLRRGCLLASYLIEPERVLAQTGATALWQEWHQIDQELVDRIHAAGGRVIAWTVNELADLTALARMGVDGLCGNYPDRIRVALSAHATGTEAAAT